MSIVSGPKQSIFSHMTIVDNYKGLSNGLARGGGAAEYGVWRVELNKNFIVGEAPESLDQPTDGSWNIGLKDKCGINSISVIQGAKTIHPTMASSKPYDKYKSYAAWGGKVLLDGNTFKNFAAATLGGKKLRIICINNHASDGIPEHEFTQNTLSNVDEGALAYLMDPPGGWANTNDCGNFPCSAPQNFLASWVETQYDIKNANTNFNYGNQFQVIHDNEGFAPAMGTSCERKADMNAYICRREHLGILTFESSDPDTEDRSMQPIYVRLQGTQMNNKLNSMMDHMWDGFYTGQKRLSRFQAVLDGAPGSVYDLVYTGSPAKAQKFAFTSQNGAAGATIRIAYPSAASRNIVKDGNIIEYNMWVEKDRQYGPVMQTKCGENRYMGVVNIFEFYITSGCELDIQPRDAIQTLVRMEWTMEAFFADGGTTTFMDRVAGALGIHASTIKIVSVYEGSLVVNYEIQEPANDLNALYAIQEKQKQLYL